MLEVGNEALALACAKCHHVSDNRIADRRRSDDYCSLSGACTFAYPYRATSWNRLGIGWCFHSHAECAGLHDMNSWWLWLMILMPTDDHRIVVASVVVWASFEVSTGCATKWMQCGYYSLLLFANEPSILGRGNGWLCYYRAVSLLHAGDAWRQADAIVTWALCEVVPMILLSLGPGILRRNVSTTVYFAMNYRLIWV